VVASREDWTLLFPKEPKLKSGRPCDAVSLIDKLISVALAAVVLAAGVAFGLVFLWIFNC